LGSSFCGAEALRHPKTLRGPFDSPLGFARGFGKTGQAAEAPLSTVLLAAENSLLLPAFGQRYTTDQTAQRRIRFGNSKLGFEAEGHSSAPIYASEHPSPLSGFLKLSQPILKFSSLSDHNP
jgi:hypothetical protein